MCRRRDSIDAVSTAAQRLELACRGVGSHCFKLLHDPSTLPLLPRTVESDAIDALTEALKTIQ